MDKENSIILSTENIKSRIYTLRGQQVMLDEDLAILYKVKSKVLNQTVKRNSDRFPEHFMFQLSKEELKILRSQFVTTSWGGRRYLPFAFTEQGVAMLSGVLKSEVAVKVSIQIMDAFVAMKRFINSNALVFQRLDKVELKQLDYDKNFKKVFDAIQSKTIKQEQGIFFNGQIFDAYKFISDLIRSAKKSILLVDNYIDDSVLTLFNKRNKNVNVTILTKHFSKELKLDLDKYNSQYPKIEIKEFKTAHDRFIIIDNKKVYHFGASLKDLGKSIFAFSKFNKDTFKLIDKLGEK